MEGWKIVLLRRRNLVRQAISRVIAAQTGQWTVHFESTRTITDQDFDFDAIARSMASIQTENANCEWVLNGLGLPYREVWHEDIIAQGTPLLAEIAAHFGETRMRPVPPKDDIPDAQRPEIQSTDLNRRWETRFRDEFRHRVSGDIDATLARHLPSA